MQFFKRNSKKGIDNNKTLHPSEHVCLSYDVSQPGQYELLKSKLAKIDPTVYFLELEYCYLGILLSKDNRSKNKKLSELFNLIPKHITHLNLRGNFLHKIESSVLKELLKAQTNVLCLSLAENHLGETPVWYQQEILANLPLNLEELDYSQNFLHTKVYSEQQAILAKTPRHLKCLNLSYNGLDGLSSGERENRTSMVAESTEIYFAKPQLINPELSHASLALR